MGELAARTETQDTVVTQRDAVRSLDDDVVLLLESGFVRRIDQWNVPFFVKQSDIRERRYPLHSIAQKTPIGSERVCWMIQWDRYAYDVLRVHERAHRLHIRPDTFLPTERTCHDTWWTSSIPLTVHEAMTLYDILNESRYSR